jgi:restriction system protein
VSLPTQTEVEIPLLRVIGQLGGEAAPRDVYGPVAAFFPQLTPEDLSARMDSGAMKWWNHVQWARQRLLEKKEIDGSVRGVWRLTDLGRARLTSPQSGGQRTRRPPPALSTPSPEVRAESPTELIESAHRELRSALISELLQLVLSSSPEFFERLVIEVLVKMGYGGTLADAGRTLGRSGDGGIDGLIKEDRLGLGVIHVQAKRWDPSNSVSRPEVQKFAGALQGVRAQKGVFITTSAFTRDARDFVERIDAKIVLIDGHELAGLMIDYGVGVSSIASYEIKRVDSDYFSE